MPRFTRSSNPSSKRRARPYFSFKDIDENKPSGAIRIRVETIPYFLTRYVEEMRKRPVSEADIEQEIAEFERRLRYAPGTDGGPIIARH